VLFIVVCIVLFAYEEYVRAKSNAIDEHDQRVSPISGSSPKQDVWHI